MPEETITLRDAAGRLARAKNPKSKGIQTSALLSLLRAGELRAGFYLLNGTAWIEIPISYWERLPIVEFRKITLERDDPESGSYALQGNQFPDQIAQIILARIKMNQEAFGLTGELIAPVIAAAGNRYEVTIKTVDFLNFLANRGLEEKTPASNAGARRKEGWRELCSYMAAYFAAHQRDRGTEPLKIDQAKDDIIKAAKDSGVSSLPAPDTLKEQISKALRLLKSDAFKLGS